MKRIRQLFFDDTSPHINMISPNSKAINNYYFLLMVTKRIFYDRY